jgi:hypothetical protein
MAFQTEVDFTLPKGYLDGDGQLHKSGVMRLATAADEILPLKDPRVQQNQAYLVIIVLARVVTKLGSLPDVNTKVIENLFASDLSYLQTLYEQLNGETARAQAPAMATPNGMGSVWWGKHEGLSVGTALRGDGLHRLPLSLAPRRADGARARRAPALVPRDLGNQPSPRRAARAAQSLHPGLSHAASRPVSQFSLPDRG